MIIPPELISSRRNPLVKRLRQLHQPRGRREQGLVMLEGTHLVQELLRLRLVPQDMLATQAWIESHADVFGELCDLVTPIVVTAEVLSAVATTDHPDGVVVTIAMPRASWGGDLPTLVLALDGLQDPGNLGTLMRTALAAGVEALWLAEGADPFQPKVLRASAGAALALPIRRTRRAELLPQLVAFAARPGAQLVATLPPASRKAIPYWQLDWQRPTVVMLGQEGAGLAPELVMQATHCVTIPHRPAVESLNVAVAAGPLLLERLRQQVER